MFLELLARIVLSSSICQVVLHLLSPILFCQCGYLSFCSLRVVSLPRQMRPHVEPPPAHHLFSQVPQAHSLHLAQLELFSSLHSLCLGDSAQDAFILAFPVRDSLLCSLIALPMRCQRCAHLSTAILGNGSPAPSLSAVTFFVN